MSVEVNDHRVLIGPGGHELLCGATPPTGIRYSLVHRQTPDYLFLHEPRIEIHRRTIFASFSNAPVLESEPAQIMRGRRSRDGGLTWSDVEVVAGAFADGHRRHETAALLSRHDGLWTFIGRYGAGSKNSLGMEVYRLDEVADRFVPASPALVARGFVPFVRPQKLENGNWIIAGHIRKVTQAAVAISDGDDLLSWRVVPVGTTSHAGYPESTLIIDGRTVVCLIRPERPQSPALVAISHDYGENFGPVGPSNLDLVDSKLFSGTLSCGHHYIIFNATDRKGLPGELVRHRLLLGVMAPGAVGPLQRVFTIVEDTPAEIASALADLGESKSIHAWAYPEAVESDGKLHVVFSMNKRHCWMATVPIRSLTALSE